MEIDPQDSMVSSTEDVFQADGPATSDLRKLFDSKYNRGVKKKKIKDVNDQFPWLRSFLKLCRSVLGSSSLKLLLNLITVYTEHVSKDVAACYSRPNRAAKLKSNMSDVIGLFHNCYMNIKMPLEDSVYMEKMSTLLTMYIDMEIKASRRGKENVKKITSKLISSLFIVLHNCCDYIIDTVLKVRFTLKKYREICIPILKRLSALAEPQALIYVRCLLVLKLWKRLVPRGEERNSINRLAVTRLGPPPPTLQEYDLTSVLPRLPSDKTPALATRFYMLSKFNLRTSIRSFLKMSSELRMNELTNPRSFDIGHERDKDHSFMENIWTDISNQILVDYSSVDTIVSDNVHLIPPTEDNISEPTHKKVQEKVGKKIKNQKKKKLVHKKEKQQIRLDSICKKQFSSLPFDIFKETKFHTNNKSDQHLPKSLASSAISINEDSVTQPTTGMDIRSEATFNNDTPERGINVEVNTNKSDFEKTESCMELHDSYENDISSKEIENKIHHNKDQTLDLNLSTRIGLKDNMYTTLSSKDKKTIKDGNVFLHNRDESTTSRLPISQASIQSIFKNKSFHSNKIIDSSVKTELKSQTNSTDFIKNSLPLSNLNKNITFSQETLKGKSEMLKTGYNRCVKLSESHSESQSNFSEKLSEIDTSSNMDTNINNENSITNLLQQNHNAEQYDGKTEPSKLECRVEEKKPNHYKIFIKSENCLKDNQKKTAHPNTGPYTVIVKKELVNCEQNKSEEIKINDLKTDYSPKTFTQNNCNGNSSCIFPSSTNKINDLKHVSKKDACLLHKILGEGDCPKISFKKNVLSDTLLFSDASNNQPKSDENGDNIYKHRSDSQGDTIKKQFLSDSLLFSDESSNKPKSDVNGENTHKQIPDTEVNTIITSDWNQSSVTIKKEEEQDIIDVQSVTSHKPFVEIESEDLVGFHLQSVLNQDDNSVCANDDYCSESGDSNLVIDEDVCSFKDENCEDDKLSNLNSKFTSDVKDYLDNTPSSKICEIGKSLVNCNKQNLANDFSYLEVKSFNERFTLRSNQVNFPKENNTSTTKNVLVEERRINTFPETEGQIVVSNFRNNEIDQIVHHENKSPYFNAPQDFTVYSKVPIVKCNPSTLSNETIKVIDSKAISAKNHSNVNINQPVNSATILKKSLHTVDSKIDNNSLDRSTEFLNSHMPSNYQICHADKPMDNIVIANKELCKKKSLIQICNQENFMPSQYHNVDNNENLYGNKTPSLHQNSKQNDMETNFPETFQNRSTSHHGMLMTNFQIPFKEPVPEQSRSIPKPSTHCVLKEKLNTDLPNSLGNTLKYVSVNVPEGFIDNRETDHFYKQVSTSSKINMGNYHVADQIPREVTHSISSSSPIDPFCMFFKNSDESREIHDEFNTFPVAHEVEVCSATENFGGEWIFSGSSEIGHPDWPIANEQSVIDSTSVLSVSPIIEQNSYSLQVNSEQCCGTAEEVNSSSVNSLELQQVSVNLRSPVKNRFSKEKLNLHIKTLEVDYNLCCSQRKFKEFYLSQNVPPAIPVPFPPQGRTDNLNKSSVRCACDQCSDNHKKLLNNYNILTHFRNSKVKPTKVVIKNDKLCEREHAMQNCDQDCSLPLKKRKTLTNSKVSEEPTLMSYPNTPMISIAQIAEFDQQNLVQNVQNPWLNVTEFQASNQDSAIASTYLPLQQIEHKQNKYNLRKPSKRRKNSRA